MTEQQQAMLVEFGRRLAELCNEFQCDLIAVPQIVDGRIIADVVAKPRTNDTEHQP